MSGTTKEQAISMIHDMSFHAQGYSWLMALNMKNYNPKGGAGLRDDYHFITRFHQPCYGEMRKYKLIHKDAYTSIDFYRPGDLYWPFPEKGDPEILAVPFPYISKSKDFSDFLQKFFTAKDNPWIRGFDSPKNVQMITKDGLNHGFILKDLNVDPTVLIQMIWIIRTIGSSGLPNFNLLLKAGATFNEALAIMMLNQCSINTLNPTDSYHYSSVFSAKRFFSGNPVDISGGTLADRFDYNRKMIQDLWRPEKGESQIDWFTDMKSFYKTKKDPWGGESIDGVTTENLIENARTLFQKNIDETKELIHVPWQQNKAYLKEHPEKLKKEA